MMLNKNVLFLFYFKKNKLFMNLINPHRIYTKFQYLHINQNEDAYQNQ